MGRYGSKEDDTERYEPPRSKPRIRIKTEAPKAIPQRKAVETIEQDEPDEQAMPAKEFIKRMVLDDDKLQPRDMAPMIKDAGYSISIVAVSGIRAEFRDSLKLLKRLGWRQAK